MKIIAVDDEKTALEGLLFAISKAAPSANVQGFQSTKEALNYTKKNRAILLFWILNCGK